MILITLLLTNILWITYSLTEGVSEGFYWHCENRSKSVCEFNVNRIFNLQRLSVLILAGGFLAYAIGSHSLFCILGMVLIFPFFHNGTYYYTRNKLDSNFYPKRWTDESVTFPTFSILTTYKKRTIAMSIGILSQIFIYLFLL